MAAAGGHLPCAGRLGRQDGSGWCAAPGRVDHCARLATEGQRRATRPDRGGRLELLCYGNCLQSDIEQVQLEKKLYTLP